MKKHLQTIVLLSLFILLVACSGPEAATAEESEATGEIAPAIEIDALGLTVSVPDRFSVLYRSGEDTLILSERLTPLRRIVVKRIEPMPVGKTKPYDYYPEAVFGTPRTVDGLTEYPYFVARGGTVIEGGLVIGGDQDSPVAILIETENGAKRDPLYAVVRAMHWRFPDTDAASYRKRLMHAATDADAVKVESEYLTTFLREHPEAANTALMDFSDYLAEAVERTPSHFLGEEFPTVKREDGREEFDRLGDLVSKKDRFSEPFRGAIERVERILGKRMDPATFVDEKDWDAYISRYHDLEEEFLKDPAAHYLESILKKEIREAHRLFILGIKDPYVARVAYSHYVQNYPDSRYREIVYDIFMRFDAHDPDYAAKRRETYEKWERENLGIMK